MAVTAESCLLDRPCDTLQEQFRKEVLSGLAQQHKVIPARWFAGGKGLDEFREAMLSDNRLRSIDDYLSAADVFPGVGLKGGVCYFLWDRDNPGACRVTTRHSGTPLARAVRMKSCVSISRMPARVRRDTYAA